MFWLRNKKIIFLLRTLYILTKVLIQKYRVISQIMDQMNVVFCAYTNGYTYVYIYLYVCRFCIHEIMC